MSDSEFHQHFGGDWDQIYSQTERLWSLDPEGELVKLLPKLKPATAVDLGCGEGRNAIYMAKQGVDVTGVDVSAVALERTRQRAQLEGIEVRTVKSDMISFIGSGERFDLVLLANFHPPSPERRIVYRAALDCVSPGGHLLIVGHHRDGLGISGPPDPDRLLTEEAIQEIFAQDQIRELYTVMQHTDHGGEAPTLVGLIRP